MVDVVVATGEERLTRAPITCGTEAGVICTGSVVVVGEVDEGGTVARRLSTSRLSIADTPVAVRASVARKATGRTQRGSAVLRFGGCVGGSLTASGPGSG